MRNNFSIKNKVFEHFLESIRVFHPLIYHFFVSFRRLGDGSSRHSSDDYTEINKTQSAAAINCKTLINEIRQAVNEAQPKGDTYCSTTTHF